MTAKKMSFMAIMLIFMSSLAHSATYQTISAAKCDSLILDHFADPEFYIIDVRTASEFASGHLYNSININYRSSDFKDQIAQLDSTATYLIHCQSGGRSAGALNVFKSLGFEEVYEMAGGYYKWKGRTTTEDLHLLYRYVDVDSAYALSLVDSVELIDVTHYEAFEEFNLKSSIYYSHDSVSVIDTIKSMDKNTPLLLYSSCEEGLDSVFQQLFVEGHKSVYYYNGTSSEWINSGYDYNTKPVVEQPDSTVSIGTATVAELEVVQKDGSLVISECRSERVFLYSLSGERVATEPVNDGNAKISLSGLKGIFFLQAGDNFKKLVVK